MRGCVFNGLNLQSNNSVSASEDLKREAVSLPYVVAIPSINGTNIITLKTQTRFTWWKGTSGVWKCVPPMMCGCPWDWELRVVKTSTARSAIVKHCRLINATRRLRCLYHNTETNSLQAEAMMQTMGPATLLLGNTPLDFYKG